LNLAGKDPKAATPRGRYSAGAMRKKPMTIDALTGWPAAFSTWIRRTAGRIK